MDGANTLFVSGGQLGIGYTLPMRETAHQMQSSLNGACRFLTSALGLALLVGGDLQAGSLPSGGAQEVDVAGQFGTEVYPLLEARCFKCHGPEKQKSGLRLDSRARILKGGEEGPALVPGDPDGSLLIAAIRRQEELEMPPKEALSPKEVEVLVSWVQAGATWPESFVAAEHAPGASSTNPVTSPDAPAMTGEPIHFNRDVRPLLSNSCFSCHGHQESARKAKIRFDSEEGLFGLSRGGESLIVPGDPDASLLYQRITHTDIDERMPPEEANLALTPANVATIRAWILQGANYESHWAFIVPARAPLPEVKNTEFARNAIDPFVLARLEGVGMTPSPEADRRTLIRRVSFDLTGLPPTRDEVVAFLDDQATGAFGRVVDRLLASPHFGERMAQAWMDQSRYADTNGYSIDGGRHMWLWRDWVINAYNQDLPFDQFLREQLAGDLLPDATQQQLVATGFNRNHMITHEGGTIPEENLNNYCVDRVKTTSEVFLGLTMACAQCHDHKFDPLSQRDFYGFYAYFNTLDDRAHDGDGGRNATPSLEAISAIRHQDTEAIQAQVASAKRLLATPSLNHQLAWEALRIDAQEERGKDMRLHPLETLSAKTPELDVARITVLEDGSVLKSSNHSQAFTVSSRLRSREIPPVTGIRIEFYPHPDVGDGSLGHGAEPRQGSFGLSAASVSAGTVPSNEIDWNHLVPLRDATASYSHADFPARNVLDPRAINGWSPLGRTKEPQHLTLIFDAPVDPAEWDCFTVNLSGVNRDTGHSAPGHFRIFAVTGNDDTPTLPPFLETILTIPRQERTAEQSRSLLVFQAANDPGLAFQREVLASLEQRLHDMTQPHSTLVMNTADNPRKTHLLERGAYDQPGEEVSPAPPAFLPPLPEGVPNDRLALADWFVSPEHPLTSRVAVNRLWQLLFGTGLVATSADFGSQGEWPSHPDLLDTLAVDFLESGWQVKRMLKQMVMSATYRQSSHVKAESLALDPQNRLLSHGPRFRLQGEFIRDAALQAGGLLVPWIGGSSVRPYQPEGLWREISHFGSTPATAQVFHLDEGLNLHRRSLYTYWKRTVPPPSMLAFDAPSRELCMMQRESTNTPMQALVLLNDPQFVEASRGFAERISHELPDAPAEQRIARMFEDVTSRPPQPHELTLLLEAYQAQRRTFAEHPDSALDLLRQGSVPRDDQLDAVEQAALTTIANLILNLSEAVTRG
ncbi:MAG: mono/diheme cytochrome c family protein [Planctomycetota bacterium]|jgi:mono/diheme cytochrome c family protein